MEGSWLRASPSGPSASPRVPRPGEWSRAEGWGPGGPGTEWGEVGRVGSRVVRASPVMDGWDPYMFPLHFPLFQNSVPFRCARRARATTPAALSRHGWTHLTLFAHHRCDVVTVGSALASCGTPHLASPLCPPWRGAAWRCVGWDQAW